ncbi:MAG TPA: LON peptidase substrate-binding domain-containing protein [Thermoanaerobaculia bacterium]|nr:LON peptidase substrate-binding domain-containing protein [Thermoanaerobaculia bacterium]
MQVVKGQLVPLEDLVYFPQTDFKLELHGQRDRCLVQDVLEGPEERARWVGLVLLKHGPRQPGGRPPAVYPGGTAGRIVRYEERPDGRTELLLHGEFRFELAREIPGEPYRQAVVRPIEEPLWNEADAGIVLVKRALSALAQALFAELGGTSPLPAGELDGLARGSGFEALVNRIAAELNLPALRKLALLSESLPDRALSLLAILHDRLKLVEELKPFRRLAATSALN